MAMTAWMMQVIAIAASCEGAKSEITYEYAVAAMP